MAWAAAVAACRSEEAAPERKYFEPEPWVPIPTTPSKDPLSPAEEAPRKPNPADGVCKRANVSSGIVDPDCVYLLATEVQLNLHARVLIDPFRPEDRAVGFANVFSMAVHPRTGELWFLSGDGRRPHAIYVHRQNRHPDTYTFEGMLAGQWWFPAPSCPNPFPAPMDFLLFSDDGIPAIRCARGHALVPTQSDPLDLQGGVPIALSRDRVALVRQPPTSYAVIDGSIGNKVPWTEYDRFDAARSSRRRFRRGHRRDLSRSPAATLERRGRRYSDGFGDVRLRPALALDPGWVWSAAVWRALLWIDRSRLRPRRLLGTLLHHGHGGCSLALRHRDTVHADWAARHRLRRAQQRREDARGDPRDGTVVVPPGGSRRIENLQQSQAYLGSVPGSDVDRSLGNWLESFAAQGGVTKAAFRAWVRSRDPRFLEDFDADSLYDNDDSCDTLTVGDKAEDALVCSLAVRTSIMRFSASAFVVRNKRIVSVLEVGYALPAMDWPDARWLDLQLVFEPGGLEADLHDRAPDGTVLVPPPSYCKDHFARYLACEEAHRNGAPLQDVCPMVMENGKTFYGHHTPTPGESPMGGDRVELQGCARALPKLDELVKQTGPKDMFAAEFRADRAFAVKSCNARGHYVWTEGRFVRSSARAATSAP